PPRAAAGPGRVAVGRRPVPDPSRCRPGVAAFAGGGRGRRAPPAFGPPPARRADCAARLRPDRLGFYLACTGLYAMLAGDLATADEQLPAAISHIRDTGDRTNLPTSLQNLAECLGHLGQGGPAQAAAAEALTCAQSNRRPAEDSCLARIPGVAGRPGRGHYSRRAALHHSRPDLPHRRPGRRSPVLARWGSGGPAGWPARAVPARPRSS